MLTIFVPPIFLIGIERARLLPKNRAIKFSLDVSILVLELYFAVPLGLALYSRQGTISASELEPEFHAVKNARGELIKEFVFNKGL